MDLEIAGDWFAVDQEQWLELDEQEKRQANVQATGDRRVAKFTSRHSTR
jgi:hypothetical protein